ncbi:hypothetical protein HYU19_05210 [Candidatus Woesearchaeota archaeon]|nr:hypothetical protein [Candidatus Woesearchaeota archaeon]
MTISSSLTIDGIAASDHVDHRYRMQFLERQYALYAAAVVGGISASSASGLSFLSSGAGILSGLVLMVGAAATVIGTPGLLRALGTNIRYNAEQIPTLAHGRPLQGGYHLIGGRVSDGATAVEREYGTKIQVASSLDDIASLFQASPGDLLFIDHLTVRRRSQRVEVEQVWNADSDGHSGWNSIRHICGWFELRRPGEQREDTYHFTGSLPKKFAAMLETNGSPISMLVSAPARPSTGDVSDAAFEVVKIYHPTYSVSPQ